jgi:RNA polymerase sigma-70 factor (ECF subfamily)
MNNQQTMRAQSSSFRSTGRRDPTNGANTAREDAHARANASKRAAALRKTAFEDMFVASHRSFLAIARMILRNREDAEDAVQNAFLSASLNLHRFEGRSALKTWFTRIVVNSALMLRRKRKHFVAEPQTAGATWPEDEWIDSMPAPNPDPEKILADRELIDLVENALGKMKPLLREAFTLTYFEGLNTREGCAAQRVPCETFKARLFRAKRRVLNHTGRALASPLYKNGLSQHRRLRANLCNAERNENSALAI